MRLIFRLVTLLFLVVILQNFSMPGNIEKHETIYSIQVASLAREVPATLIKQQNNLSEDVELAYIGGRYKYFVGRFATRAEANAYLARVNVPGAYVVPRNISQGQEAIPEQADRQVDEQTSVTRNQYVYRVQIAASARELPVNYFTRSPYNLTEPVSMQFRQGMYKYTVGRFLSQTEAQAYSNALGFQSFVVRLLESVTTQEQREDPAVIIGETPSNQAYLDSLAEVARVDSLNRIYNSIIYLADSLYNIPDYDQARLQYLRARQFKPMEPYPRDRINEIEVATRTEGRTWTERIPLLLYGIIIFVIILIVVLVIIIVLRTRRDKKDSKKEQIKAEYQDTVTEYLFDEEKSGDISNLRGADTKEKKQILIDEIMQLYSNLSGEISNKLRELYFDLDLDNESVKKIHSDKWHTQAKGFRELAQMNVTMVNDEIERCLNSTNNVLRMEAQLALIRLNYDNPFGFLDKLQQSFTAWEQLHVYEMIKRHQISVPPFSKWLNATNETVIIFSIKMIRAFKQDESYDSLVPLIKHNNKEIRKEAIVTLGELRNDQILPLLKEMYNIENKETQMLILGAMGKIPRESNIEFLREILEPNNQLRMEAAEALANIEEFGTTGLERILTKSDEDLQDIAKHILDNRI